MKTCTKCKIPKETDDFGKHSKTADRLQSWCKQCKCLLSREKRGKDKCDPYQPQKIEYRLEYIRSAKQTGCCIKCGENDPIALDFHHLKDKLFGIGGGSYAGHTLDEIKAEIAKCVLLCANCHRKFHAGRFVL